MMARASKKRMAILLFGSCRYWKETQGVFRGYADIFGDCDIDYFYAFWDKAQIAAITEDRNTFTNEEIVITPEHVTDGFIEHFPIEGKLFDDSLTTLSSFRREYLKKQVTLMKTKKEQDEDFTYDLVMFTRTDVIAKSTALIEVYEDIKHSDVLGTNMLFAYTDNRLIHEEHSTPPYDGADLIYLTSSIGAEIYGHMFTQYHGQCNDPSRYSYGFHRIDGHFQKFSPITLGTYLIYTSIYNAGVKAAYGVIDDKIYNENYDDIGDVFDKWRECCYYDNDAKVYRWRK